MESTILFQTFEYKFFWSICSAQGQAFFILYLRDYLTLQRPLQCIVLILLSYNIIERSFRRIRVLKQYTEVIAYFREDVRKSIQLKYP